MALRNQDHRNTISLCDELLASTKNAETRNKATKLRANSCTPICNPTSTAATIRGPTSKKRSKSRAAAELRYRRRGPLAEIYRDYDKQKPKPERDKAANALMARVIKETRTILSPGWSMVSISVRSSPRSKEVLANADKELDQAVSLAKKQPGKQENLIVYLVAAGLRTRAR